MERKIKKHKLRYMEVQAIKQRIKDYYVEIKEDKFTKVKHMKPFYCC
jgi:hypothetical protein